ncbi:hypothetical protein MRX96_046601 [Rhipicephalus microplus]
MPQQIAMEGDDVTPEELQGNGWFSVLKRRQESRAKSLAARQPGTQRGATATPNATQRRVAAASRLPAMPRSHNRVIVRPGGGLNVQACSPHRILAALTMAAQLAPAVADESKPSSKHPPQQPARFLPRPPKPQGPPLGPRNPTPTGQPTWADKVACKGEAHAAQRQGHSPQQPDPELAQLKRMYAEQAKEIQSLKQELAKQQAPESREGSIISGPVSIRGAKKRAGPTLQAEEQSDFDRFTANIYAILEQYRAETTAEYSAFNAKLESMQKQLIKLATWPAQMDARTKVLEEDLARSKRAGLIPRP